MARIHEKKTSSFHCAFLAGTIGLAWVLGGCVQLEILTPGVSDSTLPILHLIGPAALYTGECSATPYTLSSTNTSGNATPVSSNTVVNLSQTSGEGALFFSDSACSNPISSVTIPGGESQVQFYAKDNLYETPVINSSAAGLTGSSLTLTMSARFHQVDLLTGGMLGVGSADGTAAAARFSLPTGNATDGTYLYVADQDNGTIRKIQIATGVVTTLAGTAGTTGSADGTGAAAQFNSPAGVATDGTNVYIADSGNDTIRQIVIATGVVTTLAGTAGAPGSADGTGAAAGFNTPEGIATDGTRLYVVDQGNDTIRQIVIATGVVTTLAGTAGASGSVDGTGAAARFYSPGGNATDGTNVYVADGGNDTVRQIVIATGVVTTLAGTAGTPGSADGIGAAARFSDPEGVATDGTNVYLTDGANNTVRRIVIATGTVTTLAGNALQWGSDNGNGTAARFYYPTGIATDGTNLYVNDSYNNTIRELAIATDAVSTLAGHSDAGETDGTASQAQLGVLGAESLASPDGKTIYFTDVCAIRWVSIINGSVGTLAGDPWDCDTGDGAGTVARFNYPGGIATDGTNLYVTDFNNDTIRQIVIATGDVTTLAGTAGTPGSADGIGSAGLFNGPEGITTDGTNLYVADFDNQTIRKIVIATADVSTLAGQVGTPGSADGTGAAATFNAPAGIVTDGTDLYITDWGDNTVRQILISTGVVTTLAGTAGVSGSSDGTGAAAQFISPLGITMDGSNLYVADYGNDIIRKIVIATGVVTTIAGNASLTVPTESDGLLASSTFVEPSTILWLPDGLFVGDGFSWINQVSSLRWIH